VFVLDGGHFHGSDGAYTFAREHPDLMARTRLLLTLEHLGAHAEVSPSRQGPTRHDPLHVMFATPRPDVVAIAMKALAGRPLPPTICIPADLLGPAPTSDAMGYVMQAGLPVLSWIGCPSYLLDERDTPARVDRQQLGPISEAIADIIRIAMIAPPHPLANAVEDRRR
jgi:hypothetical protein